MMTAAVQQYKLHIIYSVFQCRQSGVLVERHCALIFYMIM